MAEAATVAAPIRKRYGFEPDMGHMTIVGRCAECSAKPSANASRSDASRCGVD